MISRRTAAWALAAAHLAATLLLLPQRHEGTAIMNAVVAESGSFIHLELLHPLYTPLLGALSRLLDVFGAARPHMAAFQALSALAAACGVAVAFALVAAATGDALLAAAAAALMGVCGGYWHWAGQAKAYAPAALACLGAVWVLGAWRAGAERRHWAASALIGLACGLTVAAAGLLTALAWAVFRQTPAPRRGRRAAACAAFFTLTLAACYAALLAVKGAAVYAAWAQPSQMISHYLHRVSIQTTLWDAPSLAAQWSHFWRFLNEAAPEIWLLAPMGLAAAAGLKHLSADRRRAAATAGLSALGLAAVLLVIQPYNGFAYMIVALALLSAAIALPGRIAVWALLLAVPAAAGRSYLAVLAPDRGKDPITAEGHFLESRLGRDDVLLCAGPPDWRLAYFHGKRLRMVRLDDGLSWDDPFKLPVVRPASQLESLIARVLAAGGRPLLAADALFLPTEVHDSAALQARVHAAVTRRYDLAAPWVSPQGQHYYPITRRKR